MDDLRDCSASKHNLIVSWIVENEGLTSGEVSDWGFVGDLKKAVGQLCSLSVGQLCSLSVGQFNKRWGRCAPVSMPCHNWYRLNELIQVCARNEIDIFDKGRRRAEL